MMKRHLTLFMACFAALIILMQISGCTSETRENAEKTARSKSVTPSTEDAGKLPQKPAPKMLGYTAPSAVWAWQAVLTPTDPAKHADPILLTRGESILVLGRQGMTLNVRSSGGHNGTLDFCDTRFGLQVARRAPEVQAIPGAEHHVLRGLYAKCLSRFSKMENIGLVLQGPIDLKPDKAAQKSDDEATRIQLESFQLVQVLEHRPSPSPANPGEYLVDAGNGRRGLISAFHLAVGGSPGWSIEKRGEHRLLKQHFPGKAERYATWFLPMTFTKQIPLSVVLGPDRAPLDSALSQADKTAIADMNWEPPIALFTMNQTDVLKRLEGSWSPAIFSAPMQAATAFGRPLCNLIPLSLSVSKGRLTISAGETRTFNIDRVRIHSDASATLMGRPKGSKAKTQSEPLVHVRFVTPVEGETAFAFPALKNTDRDIPSVWQPMPDDTRKKNEDSLSRILQCPESK